MWRGWQNSLGPQGKVVRQVFPMSKKVVLGMSLKNLKLVTMETCHFVKKNWWFKFRFMEFSHQHLSLMQVRSLDAPTCDQPGIYAWLPTMPPSKPRGNLREKTQVLWQSFAAYLAERSGFSLDLGSAFYGGNDWVIAKKENDPTILVGQ